MIVIIRSRVYLEPRPCLILANILHGSIARFLYDHAKKLSKILLQFLHVILHDHHNKNLHVFGTKILHGSIERFLSESYYNFHCDLA